MARRGVARRPSARRRAVTAQKDDLLSPLILTNGRPIIRFDGKGLNLLTLSPAGRRQIPRDKPCKKDLMWQGCSLADENVLAPEDRP